MIQSQGMCLLLKNVKLFYKSNYLCQLLYIVYKFNISKEFLKNQNTIKC